jgi:hypothetical protein
MSIVPELPTTEEQRRGEEFRGHTGRSWDFPELVHRQNTKIVPPEVIPERPSNYALEDEVVTTFCRGGPGEGATRPARMEASPSSTELMSASLPW